VTAAGPCPVRSDRGQSPGPRAARGSTPAGGQGRRPAPASPPPGWAPASVALAGRVLAGPWSLNGRGNVMRFGVRPERQLLFPDR